MYYVPFAGFVYQPVHLKTGFIFRIDPKRMDTNEILDRAKYFLQRNDLKSTVRLMQLLGGEAARVAHDWIKDTRMHLETKMIAEALVAHSTINGIRTTY